MTNCTYKVFLSGYGTVLAQLDQDSQLITAERGTAGIQSTLQALSTQCLREMLHEPPCQLHSSSANSSRQQQSLSIPSCCVMHSIAWPA